MRRILCLVLVVTIQNFGKHFVRYNQPAIQSWFRFTPLQQILQNNPEIGYQFCFDKVPFDFKKFPLSIDQSKQPHQGILFPTFILTIPDGIARGMHGDVFIENNFIREMIWRNCINHYTSVKKEVPNIVQVSGKVAIITQPAYHNYFHWIVEVLCRLAMLEIYNVKYDYLYTPQKSKYMRDTLEMWGIPKEKIIAPESDDFAIQAYEIILPSIVINTNHGWTQLVNYIHPKLLEYVKNKLLVAAQKKQVSSFAKKIFISRKDAPFRKILNEDEVFEPFKSCGFERYELSKLSVAEQIMLFNQAEIIVSPQGTGLANSIFCTSKTKIIELFQGLCDSTFWYVSQTFNLNYTPIQTIPFELNYFKAWQGDTYMPANIIEKVQQYF